VIAEFIRGQLRQAGFERAVLGLSGGIDSALVAYLVAEAIGAERLLCVMLPYRTSSPASRGRCRDGRRGAWLRERAGRDQPDGRRLLRPADGVPGAAGPRALDGQRPAPGQLHGPGRGCRPVRPVGDVGRPGRRDRQQDRIADRLHDALRRFARAPSTRSATCTRARSASWRSAVGVPEAIIRKAPSADLWPGQTDEAEAGLQLPRARPAAVLAGRQAALARGARGDGVRPGARSTGSDRMVAGVRVQAPGAAPIAKLGPRTPGVDYLYPRRGPAPDTRITRRLFARHGITTHLVPHHARNEAATIPGSSRTSGRGATSRS
jgi:NAD+ synthase